MEKDLVKQIVTDLNYLVEQAKKRKVEQGILTFRKYINNIQNEKDPKKVNNELSNLTHEMSGMSRFAYFPNHEWQVFDKIQENIQTHLEK